MNKSVLETGHSASRIPHEVAALLSAFQLRSPDMSSLMALSDRQWASLIDFSDRAQLTLPMAQLPMAGFPHWVVERLGTNLADNALRFERIKATYREAVEALERAGIEHLVIKGFTQAPDYVPDRRLRAQSDIDIFCPSESIDAACGALESIGYKPSTLNIDRSRADHRPAFVRPGNWKWRGNRFDPEMPLSIELHFCLWNESVSRIADPGTGHFWSRRTRREVEGLAFSCLNPVDHLAYLALHILRNLFLRDWIIAHVRELAFFLHTHADDEAFWQTWTETHSPLLRSYAAVAFFHAHAWFGCLMHPLPAREIDRLPAKQQNWLGYFSGSAIELMFHPNKDSVWLHLSLLTSLEEQLRVLGQAFIPNVSWQIGNVRIQTRNGRLVQHRGRHSWQRFLSYLVFGGVAYTRTTLDTLRRGVRWRLEQIPCVDSKQKTMRPTEE